MAFPGQKDPHFWQNLIGNSGVSNSVSEKIWGGGAFEIETPEIPMRFFDFSGSGQTAMGGSQTGLWAVFGHFQPVWGFWPILANFGRFLQFRQTACAFRPCRGAAASSGEFRSNSPVWLRRTAYAESHTAHYPAMCLNPWPFSKLTGHVLRTHGRVVRNFAHSS